MLFFTFTVDSRSQDEIQIITCEVYVNPFKEVEEMLAKERSQASYAPPLNPNIEIMTRPKPGNRTEEEALAAENRLRLNRAPGLFCMPSSAG